MATEEYVLATAPDGTPKYVGRAGVTGWSGVGYDFVGSQYDGLPFQGQEMWLVRVWADQSTLDSITAEIDAYAATEFGLDEADIAAALNDWSGRSLTYDEWWTRFTVA